VSLYAGEGGNLGTGKGGSGRPTGAGKGVVPSWWGSLHVVMWINILFS
jgi:hypothetical protein